MTIAEHDGHPRRTQSRDRHPGVGDRTEGAHMTRGLIRLGAAALVPGATLGVVGIVGLVGLVGLVGTAAIQAGTGAVAGAATTPTATGKAAPTTLAGIKAKAATDITDRVNKLKGAIAKVNGAQALGAGQGTLVSYLGADIVPLQRLNQKIQADTTVAEAAQDFGSIFTGYRVYALVLPAARIAAGSDGATMTAIPKLTSDAAKAQAQVNPGNQTQVQPLIDDLNGQIGTATNASNGLAATVLAFTPAQWNANVELLAASRSSGQTAIGALEKGRSDVRQVVQDLKGTATSETPRPADSTTTTTA